MGVLGAWRRVAVGLAVAVAATGVRAGARAVPQALETDVKAAFLFNFTKFVDWPRTALSTEPFRLCVVSDDALRHSLERTIEGERVDGRPLQSLAPRTADEARSCQVLFIGKGADDRESKLLGAVQDLPVLTVSDIANFARRGGGIEFVREKNRLRFDVNLPGAERGGIKVSSRLLQVARNVHESPKK